MVAMLVIILQISVYPLSKKIQRQTKGTGDFWADQIWDVASLSPDVSVINSSVEVVFIYSDCNGNWSYGVAIDDIILEATP